MSGTIDKEIRFDRDALAAELELAGAVVRGTGVKCPFHEDKSASGSLYRDEGGVWRFKCHAGSCGFGGDVHDVRAKRTGIAPGHGPGDDMRPRPVRSSAGVEKSSPAGGQTVSGEPDKTVYPDLEAVKNAAGGYPVEGCYAYADPETQRVEMAVLRIRKPDGKAFWQFRPVEGGFIMEAPPKPWPIYNRTRLQGARVAVVVEGEKCVHALQDIGVVATTSPGGAKNGDKADWRPLAGKTVYLWPDNDPPGTEYMRTVERMLADLDPAPTVLWIDPADLNMVAKGDTADFIEGLGTIDRELKFQAVQDVLAEARSTGPAQDVKRILDDTISGRRAAVAWPWPILSRLTRALLPGTVTLTCGDPGAGKSFFLLQAVAFWFDQGIKAAVYELEEDRAYHLYRALTQRTGDSHYFDDEWVKANADQARAGFEKHKAWLDGFGKILTAAPDRQVSLMDVARRVRDLARAGYRIIVIDPVTAATVEGHQWEADLAFMMAVKAAVRDTGASLVLVTHPRKGRKQAWGLDELAGGAAYQRFSQTILWIEDHKTPKEVTIHSPVGGVMPIKINRSLHIVKTRNGSGHGLSLAYRFNGGTLTFEEKGIITNEGKE